jgi:aldose sugar dehydrogenase
MRIVLTCVILLFGGTFALAQTLETSTGTATLTPMLTGLDEPWAIAHLPQDGNGAFLVTERDGALLYVSNGTATKVSGVPDVVASGQGGLLDVMLPRDFAQTRAVFLSYSKSLKGGAGTALAVGTLNADGTALRDVRDLFVMSAGSQGGRHFGSRIVEGADGSLFLTIGDRGDRPSAQDRSVHNGSVIRINRDGSVPADNPFVGVAGIRPEIYSFGHRNPQGAALDSGGTLWVAEHGAQGGDEVNRIRKGANFGWPVISYGKHYSGAKIGEGTAREGMEQPAFYWDPSIAPSGMVIYSGALWPEWRGDMLIGSLKFDYIARLDGETVREVEQISGPETERVRDVVEAPDGSIWFISVGQGAVYRMTPR